MLRNRVVLEMPDMEKKCLREEQVYKRVNSLELKMAIYIPKQMSERNIAPGILFLHGGPLSITRTRKVCKR